MAVFLKRDRENINTLLAVEDLLEKCDNIALDPVHTGLHDT